MSGDLFAVYGKIQYSPLEQCPEELRNTVATLQCKEGDVFEVEAEAACMSRLVKSALLAAEDSAGGVVVPLPLKKATVTKVVEFMKYHVSNPFGALRTPLESDNLVECGATKWDNSFVSVDKELLIDLVLASALLQLPSLFFLTGAKLAAMTKDKPADKLLKDFALALDMGAEEEEVVKERVTAAQKARWGQGYDNDSLTAVACIVSALSVAAEKSGAISAKPSNSYRLASWRAAVMADWQLLADAPEELKEDRELLTSVLPASSGWALKFAGQGLKGDRPLVMEALRSAGSGGGALLAEATAPLRGDAVFVLEAIKAVGGSVLLGAADDLRGNRGFILNAAKAKCGSCLQGAAEGLNSERELVMEASVSDAEAFKFAAEELRNDKMFVLEIVRRSGAVLQYVPHTLKCDRDVVSAAVGADASAGVHAHASRRHDMGMEASWDGEGRLREAAEKEEGSGTAVITKFVPCPNRPDITRDDEGYTRKVRVQKFVLFSGMGTITPNIGQVNYLAANSLHDRMPCYSRPEVDTVTLLQGAVGGTVGMRWKAFASADQLAAASPESMLQIIDECRILDMLCTRMDPPECVAGAFIDELSRQYMLAPAAGVMQGPPVGMAGELAAPRPAPQKKAEPEPRPEPRPAPKETGPLGGWPSLSVQKEELAVISDGARVQVVGLAAHNKLNGLAGTVMRQFKDGKWKVKMDNGQGNVLVTKDRLRVLETEDEPPPLESRESDDEPPALENRESEDEGGGRALLANARPE